MFDAIFNYEACTNSWEANLMTENSPDKPRRIVIPALVSALTIVVAVQAWFMSDMKHQLDALRATPKVVETAADTQAPVSVAPPRQVTNLQTSQQDDNRLNPQVKPQSRTPPLHRRPAPFDDDLFQRRFNNAGNWDPYREIERMQREMEDRFNQAFSHFNQDPDFQSFFDDRNFMTGNAMPGVEIKDEGKEYVVLVDLPGADKDNISVKLEDQMLTVSGEQNFRQEKSDDFGNTVFRQQSSGAFSRSVTLPGAVKPGSMHTEYANDVLRITISKAA